MGNRTIHLVTADLETVCGADVAPDLSNVAQLAYNCPACVKIQALYRERNELLSDVLSLLDAGELDHGDSGPYFISTDVYTYRKLRAMFDAGTDQEAHHG